MELYQTNLLLNPPPPPPPPFFPHALFQIPESVDINSSAKPVPVLIEERRYQDYKRKIWTFKCNPPTLIIIQDTTAQELDFVKCLLRSTMNDVINFDTVEVSRIWNRKLYSKFSRKQKSFRNGNDPKVMFRGTQRTPTIYTYTAQDGYGHPANSDFGDGIYFAEDAKYAAKYAYEDKKTGKKELTLALILSGDTNTEGNIDYINPKTHRPYDSCMKNKICSIDEGLTSICCATRHVDQSYPLYIIKYTEVTR